MTRLAIDIGSNTIKCLFARKCEKNGIQKIFEKTLDSRISCGLGLVGNAADLIADSLEIFIGDALAFDKNFQVCVVATSALRCAENSREVLLDVFKRTNLNIKILSESEEASLSYAGAMSDPSIAQASRRCFFDLGGGSMEVVFGESGVPVSLFSFPVGAVSTTREFFPTQPPSVSQVESLAQYFDSTFSAAFKGVDASFENLVGAGGAVVAARFMKRECLMDGAENTVTFNQLCEMSELILPLSCAQRVEKFHIPAARADIIAAAFVCMISLMNVLKAEKLYHTFHNLRYGLIENDSFWQK